MSLTPRLDRLDKNYIINGAMDFWQRATSMTTVDSIYVADRFVPTSFGSQSTTTSRSSDVPASTNLQYSYQVEVGTANASPSTGHHETIRHHIEGNNFAQLKGKTFTLGFWVKSSLAGIYSAVFGNSAQDRVLVKEYTINAVNTWEYKTITVLHDPSGTWLYDSGKGLSVTFCLMAGSTYRVSPNAWQGTAALASVNQVNLLATVSNIFRMTGISLIEGDKAVDSSEFVRAGNSYASELALCQRYYEKSYNLDVFPGANTEVGALYGYSNAATSVRLTVFFAVTKRTVPVCHPYSTPGSIDKVRSDSSIDYGAFASNQGINSFAVQNSVATEVGIGMRCQWTADAEL